MMQSDAVVPDEVRDVIREFIREQFTDEQLERVDVTAALDHHDESSLFVDVYPPLCLEPIDPSGSHGLTRLLRSRLDDVNEDRFPYIRHHSDEDQRVAG